MKSLPNITSLRFFLALLVVIYHVRIFFDNRGLHYFENISIFNRGTEAVYIFFSLSGFLIIRHLYIEKVEQNTINLKAFFLKRIVRIFPLYYLVLIFGFLYYRTILPAFGYPLTSNYNLVEAFFLSVTFFSNILYTYTPGGVIEILWSIGIEEQFYLAIAPLILLLPTKRIVPFLILFTILYFLIFFNKNCILLRAYQMYYYYFSFSGLLAILSVKSDFFLRIFKYRPIVILLFVAYLTTPIFKSNFSVVNYHLFGMVLFGLTICLLVLKPIKFLENENLKYLGKISYGIYMLNVIVIQFVGFIYLKVLLKFNLSNISLILIINFSTIVITVFAAHLSYKYYESFFIKFKKSNTII